MRCQIVTIGRFFTGEAPGGGTTLQGEFFFSTDHCQPTEYLKHGADWVPCSIGIPMIVTERPGLEDGLVDSLEKYLLVFHTREKMIANPCPRYKVDFEDEVLASRGNPEAAPLEALIPLKYPKVSPCPLLDCCEQHGDMCSDCHPEAHEVKPEAVPKVETEVDDFCAGCGFEVCSCKTASDSQKRSMLNTRKKNIENNKG